MHAVNLAKECPHSLRFKDVYLCIVRNQLSSCVSVQRRVKTDALNYAAINEIFFDVNTQES